MNKDEWGIVAVVLALFVSGLLRDGGVAYLIIVFAAFFGGYFSRGIKEQETKDDLY